ncbi:MAG: MFS transporter [Chloroflexi bacterium]|nr:MFS transporter [Chloroflexota bacterium]
MENLVAVSDKREAGKRRFFYGWWLLGAGTILLAMQGAFMAYGFNAFFVPLSTALGASRGTLSVAFSFTRLESAVLGPIGGYLIDRFGPRTMIYLGFALLGVGYILFSRVTSVLGFYLVFPLIALGASWSGFLPVATAVNNWFSRRRGLATGISSAGVNIGGVLVAVVAIAISTYGWRTTALCIAFIAWFLGFPLASFIRHRPQPYGYLPDGDDPDAPRAQHGAGGNSSESGWEDGDESLDQETPDFTVMEALRTQAFWVITITHGISVLIIAMVTIHEIPLLVDAGISFETAASLLALMTGIAVVGRVSGGYLGDKVGMKPVLLVCFFMMSAGVIVLATATTVTQAVIWAVLYGLGYGARAPILIALRGEYFGPRNFATIMGFSQPILMIGTFFGPIIAGFAYDVQGSYRMVFTAIALVNLLGAALVPFIKRPALPRRGEATSVASP